MKEPWEKNTAPRGYAPYRTIRQKLTLVFSCLTALPFCVFAFVYSQIGTFQTALSGALIALALILVLEGFIIFRRMAEHIEQLSGTMEQAETGKLQRVHDTGETRELAVIADTFNRTLSKLEETARDLGVKALKASTLYEIREIVSKTIHMEEVAKVILERAMRAVNAQAGYLAVKENEAPVLRVAAASGFSSEIPDEISFDPRVSLAGQVLRRRSPILIEDVEQETQLKELNKPDLGLARLLVLPVVAKDVPIGSLALGKDRKEPPFEEEDVQFLQTLLQQVAYGFENARLYQNLEQSRGELQVALDSQKKTQDQLLASARMAAFGDLSVHIAHELNNPLTSILGYADLAFDSLTGDEETRANLEMIRSQAARAGEITRSLLDFFNTESGLRVPTDLNELVRKTLRLMQSSIAEKGIHVDLKLAQPPPFAMADPGQIGQVLFNLINNAANAMTGKYRVRVGADAKELGKAQKQLLLRIETKEKDGKALIAFTDTGSGIGPDDLAKIFDPFFSTQERVSQVGLGLWVSYRIVEAHGGKIQVKSIPGKGSVFVVILPARRD